MSRYFDDNILHTGMIDEDELLHYGVKGMKWRKRLKSRLTKKALEYNRQARSAAYEEQNQKNRKSNLAKRKNAIINGRKTYSETNQSRFKGHGFVKNEYYTPTGRDGKSSLKDYETSRALADERENKAQKKKEKYRRREKAMSKLAKIIGG